MMETLDEQPKGKQDYDQWISDGIIVGKSKLIVLLCHIMLLARNVRGFRVCHSFKGLVTS